MKINYDIDFKLPLDDFYLQWEHIYWWQFKFNMTVQMEEELKRLGVKKK